MPWEKCVSVSAVVPVVLLSALERWLSPTLAVVEGVVGRSPSSSSMEGTAPEAAEADEVEVGGGIECSGEIVVVVVVGIVSEGFKCTEAPSTLSCCSLAPDDACSLTLPAVLSMFSPGAFKTRQKTKTVKCATVCVQICRKAVYIS